MKEKVISVTQAARNFADCVNRVYYQKLTLVLLKNGKAVARIVPETPQVCTGSDLAEFLAHAVLSPQEATLWRRDLMDGRKALKKPSDKWS